MSSRALVWAVGAATALVLGVHPGQAPALDPNSLASPFHSPLANVLTSPAARWDTIWFLGIAKSGYQTPEQTVFFPLYPLLVGSAGALVGSGWNILVGILISCACALGALFLLHRLVALEFGLLAARNAVWIFAWLPTALFLSAVYSEALFLLLTLGSFYAARTGRWWLAGVLGGLAAATRNSGILLIVPLSILYLYGPRTDSPPDRPARGLRPRYRLRANALWIALVSVGLLGYLVYLKLVTGNGLNPIQEQDDWSRSFIPLGGVPLGLWAGAKAAIAAVPGGSGLIGVHMSADGIVRRVVELGSFGVGCWLLWQAWRRLPFAYTAFAAFGFFLAVSAPSHHEPLRSMPRFTLVLFPLWIALALWATERDRIRTVLVVCAPLLILETLLFTSWTWAA